MTTTITTQALLERAADVIDQRGFYQGNYINPATGCVCTLGAFRVAVAEANGVETDDMFNTVIGVGDINWDRINEVDDAVFAMQEYFTRHSLPYEEVADWNDTTGRTKDEVTAVLRAAAEEVE